MKKLSSLWKKADLTWTCRLSWLSSSSSLSDELSLNSSRLSFNAIFIDVSLALATKYEQSYMYVWKYTYRKRIFKIQIIEFHDSFGSKFVQTFFPFNFVVLWWRGSIVARSCFEILCKCPKTFNASTRCSKAFAF